MWGRATPKSQQFICPRSPVTDDLSAWAPCIQSLLELSSLLYTRGLQDPLRTFNFQWGEVTGISNWVWRQRSVYYYSACDRDMGIVYSPLTLSHHLPCDSHHHAKRFINNRCAIIYIQVSAHCMIHGIKTESEIASSPFLQLPVDQPSWCWNWTLNQG